METPDNAVDRLNSNPEIADYFTSNGNRIAACRAMLDLLGIPHPEWAQRDVSGRGARHRAMLSSFKRDHPDLNLPRGYVPPKPR